ncbi:hypothetical protein [Legionella maioricensis]|uniref:Uncharacterized protein n=1 Tax=Legionella maioricensis TaxID=2896528 RepID=A0A9X2D4D2_9GAMM|nr:hypothetical protein [Legionella maioricensis]MCL9685830.1 hypothetical protein [Legionella maioricensis]MCL9689236.1 hypothetical protein [Legionella maioricensis]
MDQNELNEKDVTRLLCDTDYLTKKYFRDPKFCMAYNKSSCSGEIIQSHIISKKYLINIARDSHVYTPVGSSYHQSGLYEFKLKGLSQACHINGFCKKHDKNLFESFENFDFVGQYNQIYALTFRAVCREYFQKLCLLDIYKKVKRGYFKKIEKTTFSSSSYFIENFKSLRSEIRDLKFIYTQLKKYNRSGIKYILMETSKIPISATGVIFPIRDATGKKIQGLNEKQLGFVYNLISLQDKSYILIATVKAFKGTYKVFMESIYNLPEDKKINFLLTYFFFNNDSIAISPEWYEGLSIDLQKKLIGLMNLQVGRYMELSEFTQLLNFATITNTSILKAKIIV